MLPQLCNLQVSEYRGYQVYKQRSYRPMLPILFPDPDKPIVSLMYPSLYPLTIGTMVTPSNGNIFRVTCPLLGESIL